MAIATKENHQAPLRVLRPTEREHRESGNRFVGRERELGELRRAVDESRAGRSRLLLVSGEPGIGKTRLAEEIAVEAANQGLRVVWGRCWEGGGAPAYWPWMQILRALVVEPSPARAQLPGVPAELVQLLPELPSQEDLRQTKDPQEARFKLFDATATTLRELSRRQPLVLIIDDLHDADQSSLEMLKFVARTLTDAHLLIVATYRDAEVQRSPALASTVAILSREAPQFLLCGLSSSEVAGFVQDRAGATLGRKVVATIAEATAGNPLFLEGVMRMLIAEGKLEHPDTLRADDLKLPDSQRMAIAMRLARLSPLAQAVLPFAAALGIEFDLVPLETVAYTSGERLLELLDEVVGAGLLRSLAHNRYRFAHALIRASIYDQIGSAARITLHRNIAEKLQELHRPNLDSHLAELAYHYTIAAQRGDPRKAIEYSIRAAGAADRLLAYAEAFTLRETALRLLDDSEPYASTRAHLLSEMGRVAGLSGRLRDEVTGYYEAAIAIYVLLNDREQEARGRFKLGIQLVKGDDESYLDVARARAELTKAEAMVAPMGDSTQLGEIRNALSLVAWQALDPDFGLEAAENSMRADLDDFWWCSSSNFRSIHLLHSGRMREAFEQFDAGAKRARGASDPLARFRSACHAGNLRLWSWQPDLALRDLGAGIVDLMLSRGSLQHQMLSRGCGLAATMIGDLERARGFLRDGPLPLLEGQLALYAGLWERARDILGDGVTRMRKAGARAPLSHYLIWLARVAMANGELIRAESLLREGAEIASAAHAQLFEMFFRPELASIYTRMNRPNDAKINLDRCQEIISAGENWYGLAGHLARAEGEFAASQHDWISAVRSLERAILNFREYRLPWEEARALEARSKAAAQQGDSQTAFNEIDAALAIYREHGAGQPWVDRVQAERETALASSRAPQAKHVAESLEHNVFRKQGEYWTLSFGGADFNLKDTKGLRYIAHLLRSPGEEVAAIDLAALAATGDSNTRQRTVDLGDAGEVLDAKARADYRRRLDELREEIERLRRMNDIGALERAETEYGALTTHLTAAAGLGGRTRRTASHRDRARVAVTRSIRAAIERIRALNPSLGRHLAKSIRTGHFCCYAQSEPMPGWQF